MSLDQSDIDRLAGQVDRLTMLVTGVGRRVEDQEILLRNIEARMTTDLAPVIDRLNMAFQDAEAVGQEVLAVVQEADAEVLELANAVSGGLSDVLANPPVTESLDTFETAIATAADVNDALHGRLAALTEVVEGAEANVFSAFDALSDKSSEISETLVETLTTEAEKLTETMAEEVFGPIREAIDAMTSALVEVADETISDVLKAQIERLGTEVAEQFEKVLAFLRTAIEDMTDGIVAQLGADTENEQSARAVLEAAVAPLDPLMDKVKEAYDLFKGIADSVGVPLPDLG
ncbi:MAG: hypothetical protein R3F50_18325 [Gammaproteobacteria bacterium]